MKLDFLPRSVANYLTEKSGYVVTVRQSTCHWSWWVGFESRSGHTEDLINGTCGLSSLVLGISRWVQGEASRALLPVVYH